MNKKKKRKFKHLTQSDRDRIEAMLTASHQQKEIAAVLRVDKSTISLEIKKHRRRDGRYESTTAQHKSQVSRGYSKYQGMKVERYPDLKADIIAGLLAKRSPDEIAGRWRSEKRKPRIGKDAIYKWLYGSWGQRYCHLLCTRRYRKRKQKRSPKREMIQGAVSLVKRPKQGVHAQADLFVSSKASGTQRSGLVVVVPRVKLMLGTIIENKKPAVFAAGLNQVLMTVNVDDVTLDRGIENRDWKQFMVAAFFCDPHSPWQKPEVEGGIGLVRRWFIKKKTDLTTVSEDDFQRYLHILNNKWRKSLGYKSAYEVALEHGILKTKNLPLVREIANDLVAFH